MKLNKYILEAVNKEIMAGKFLLQSYRERITLFEKKFKMGTAMFLKLFKSGKIGDKEEYFEWFALCQGINHWENKLHKLCKV